MAKKTQRGGARPGAGRKPKYTSPTYTVTFSLPGLIVGLIDERCEREGKNRSEVATELLARTLRVTMALKRRRTK